MRILTLTLSPPPACIHLMCTVPSTHKRSPTRVCVCVRASTVPNRRDALRQLQALGGHPPPPPNAAATSSPPPTLPLAFLDHAWGATPPRVQRAALGRLLGLLGLGNSAWDVLFGALMPAASAHVLRLLGLQGCGVGEGAEAGVGEGAGAGASARVHWGHNSHELVWRAASVFMERPVRGGGCLHNAQQHLHNTNSLVSLSLSHT